MTGTQASLFSTPSLVLAVVGVASVFFAAWVNTVDVALSRMSLAYADELEREGKKGATKLVSAVEKHKKTAANMVAVRATFQTLGYVSLALAIAVLVARLGVPWWAVFLITLAGTGAAQLLSVGLSMNLLSGSRYVSVALVGAPLADRILSLWAVPIPSGARKPRTSSPSERNPEARLLVIENLRELVDQVESEGVDTLPEEDRKLIRSVFQLGTTRVGEIMVPRGEMVTIGSGDTLEDALRLFVHSGFSRVPVVGKNLDDITGVLYLKDVVKRVVEVESAKDMPVSTIARAAAFIPEMKLADNELRDMQETNNHIALVVDEYGGIAGLVTAEDVIEELVGDMMDEHDRKGGMPVQVREGTWQVPTSMAIDDLAELLDCRIDEDEIYSVGGLLTKATGTVLLPGVSATVGDLHLEAADSVGRRRKVLSVLVTKVQTPVEEQVADTSREKNGE